MGYIAYPDYKESGLDIFGKIPTHWKTRRLADIAELITSTVDKKSQNDQREVRLCNYVDVYKNRTINKSLEFMLATASNAEIEKFRLVSGDVIITKDSESPHDIGVPALVTESAKDLLCGYHLTIIRSHKEISGSFLYYSLQALTGAYQFTTSANGVTRFGLTSQGTKNIRICVPTPVEQVKIAGLLDHKTAQIDLLIEKKQEFIGKLQEMRSAFISHAVTSGIENGVTMKDPGIEWLGAIPAHWKISKLKFESKIVDCKNRTPEYFPNGEYLVVRTSNVRNGELLTEPALHTDQENFEEWTKRGIPPAGSILFTREAPAGAVCLVPAEIKLCLGQRMMNFIIDDHAMTEFILYFLMSNNFQQYIEAVSSGSTVTHLRVEQGGCRS